MSEISAIAEAVTALCNIYLSYLNPSQQNQVSTAYKTAQSDMRAFCDALRRGDVGTCNLLINGLRSVGPLPELTTGEIEELERIVPNIDGATLANLYCRARESDFAASVNQIASTSGSGSSSSQSGSTLGAVASSAATVASVVSTTTK